MVFLAWVPAWGSLEPCRRDGKNAQQTGGTGAEWGPAYLRGIELAQVRFELRAEHHVDVHQAEHLSKISVKYAKISEKIRQISLNFGPNFAPRDVGAPLRGLGLGEGRADRRSEVVEHDRHAGELRGQGLQRRHCQRKASAC